MNINTLLSVIGVFINATIIAIAVKLFSIRIGILQDQIKGLISGKADLEKTNKELERTAQRLKDNLAKSQSKQGNALYFRLLSGGFLTGFAEDVNVDSEMAKRLDTLVNEKEHISKYASERLVSEIDKEDKKILVFIESGSTLAFFSRDLAKILVGIPSHKRPDILTNNFISQMSVFGLRNVNTNVIEGTLRKYYLAYLPFGRTANIPKSSEITDVTDEKTKRKWLEEQKYNMKAFRTLSKTIANCSVLYITASNFGFLVGPMVGSLDNAMFKYCLFSNRGTFGQRTKVRMCIAGPKIFQRENFTQKDVNEHLYRTCVSVFNVPNLTGRVTFIDNLMDIDAFLGNGSRMTCAPTELGLTYACGKAWDPEYGFSELGPDTWLAFLQSSHVELELIIGIDSHASTRTKDSLLDSMNKANVVLRDMGIGGQYDLLYSDENIVNIRFK
jgi:hypothetical protein